MRISAPTRRPWKRLQARIVQKLLPLSEPRTAALRRVTEFSAPTATPVAFRVLAAPDVSPDLSCRSPSTESLGVRPEVPEGVDLAERLVMSCPDSANLSEWLVTAFADGPGVASLLEPLGFPGARGKNYRLAPGDQAGQLALLPAEADLAEQCVHGMTRAWCGICAERGAPSRQWRESTILPPVDAFDLILPVLQLPLGKDFDSAVDFARGQQLYPFQRDGVRFLAERESALLGDEMGLGMSIQAIIALRILFRMGKMSRVILLCPKSVVYDWAAKFWEWAPELNVVRVRAPRYQRLGLWKSPAHVYITTYETWREDVDRSVPQRFDGCILDEIQRIKNPGAGVTQAARRIDARFRWGLSGTPLENKVEDVVSIFAYLRPRMLRISDAEKPWLVKKRIAPYFLRRRAADVLDDLPDKISQEVSIELGDSQRRSYDIAYAEARGSLQKNRTRMNALASITRLKQICNIDPATGESSKFEYLVEKLEELSDQGGKALVFSQYPNKTLKQLLPRLQQYDPMVFDGSLSDGQREALVTKFQAADDRSVFLMSVKAGGTGLTLTEANHVFHFDMWWNPATAKQAEGRAHRIGQDKTVFVKTLYTVDTIEERIREILRRKDALFTEVIDDLSVAVVAHRMTDEELFGLFDLKPPAADRPVGPVDRTVRRLRDFSPREFESLVARLYDEMGYSVSQTQHSHDAGVDIYCQAHNRCRRGQPDHPMQALCRRGGWSRCGSGVVRRAAG